MGTEGYVSACVLLLLYVGFHCLSLRVSAYMAIFKCVGVFAAFFGSRTKKKAAKETP
jgi:hypothetical protein